MKYLSVLLVLLLSLSIVYAQDKEQYTLQDCISMAIDHNSDLKAARNQIITAKANTDIAKSDYYPNLTLNNQTFETRLHGDSTMQTGTTLSSSLKLFDTGLRYLTLKGAKTGENETINNVFRTYQTVLYNVMTSYYNCQRYKEFIDLKSASVKYYTEEEEEYKAKIELGELAPVDIYPIQASLADSKITLLSAENLYNDSKRDLINLLGISEDDNFDFAYEPLKDNDLEYSNEEYIKMALENRKDLKAGDFAVESALINKKKADMDLWPLFHVDAEISDDINHKYSSGKHTDGRIMGYISWNIFDGFNTQARIKQSKVQVENAKENRAQLERDIVKNLKNLYTDITIARQQLEASKLGFDSASKNRDVQREKFSLNMNTNLDILNSQVQYDTAMTNLIGCRYDLMLSYIDLDYQTGMLGLEDERINIANQKKIDEVNGTHDNVLGHIRLTDKIDQAFSDGIIDKGLVKDK